VPFSTNGHMAACHFPLEPPVGAEASPATAAEVLEP
jgi:hypothetical protein